MGESHFTEHAAALVEQAGECAGCHAPSLDDRCGACGCARVVKGYQVLRVLSRSAQVRVYLAEDADGRRVALKEIAFPFAPDTEQLAAFVRESDVLAQLDHPQLPRHIDSFTLGTGAGQRLYLAQGFIAGETLEQRLNNHRFSAGEVRVLVQQLLEPIVHLQSLQPMVIHRDLKPSNVVLRPDGTVALADFGSARAVIGTAGHALPLGTPGYMPPEQLLGKHNSTTDVFAIAATALQLLSRLEPHEIFAQGPLNVRRWAPVDAGFAAFLSRALAPEPKERFPDAATALAALKIRRGSTAGSVGRFVLIGAAILTVPAAVAALDFYHSTTQRRPEVIIAAPPSPTYEEPAPAPLEHTGPLPAVTQVTKGPSFVKVAGVEAVPEALVWIHDEGLGEVAAALQMKLDAAGDKQMVVGRLVVPDDLDPTTVQAPMEILENGWFAAELDSLKAPLQFAGYDLEPLAVQVTRASKGTAPLFIGEVHQSALADAHRGDLYGQLTGNLYEATVQVSFVTIEGEPRVREPDDPTVELDANGRFRIAKATPGKYRLTIDAPDQLQVIREVTIAPGKTTNVAPIELVPALTARLSWISHPDGRFTDGYSQQGRFESNDSFAAFEGDSTDDFGLEQRGGKFFAISKAQTGEPWGVADLGGGALDEYEKISVKGKKLARVAEFELKPGHVYLVRSPRDVWVLLKVAELMK